MRYMSLLVRAELRVLFGASIIVASLRDYLFGTGLYVYRDWSWPLSTELMPTLFSPSGITNSTPNPLGFTRMFVTWPVYLISQLTGDIVLAEKIFIVYLFSIFILLSYLLSYAILQLMNKHSQRLLVFPKSEVFMAFLVLFSFANFWALEQLSGFYFTYVIEFMLIAISAVTILLWEASFKAVALGGVCLSFCSLLDPNLYLFGLLTLLVTMFVSSLSRQSIPRFLKRFVSKGSVLVAVTLPGVLTVLLALSETSGTNLRAAGSYRLFGANVTPENVVRLMGYWWPLIALGPPSILNDNISGLPTLGSPASIVLLPEALTFFWLSTTWSVPLFAFSTLMIRRFRKISIPPIFVALTGLLLTQPSIFPLPYMIVSSLSSVPILGGALLTVFALPDHALIMVAVGYIVLVGIGVYFLFTGHSPANLSIKASKAAEFYRLLRRLTPEIALILLLFPAWQFFSGSFYPAGYTPGAGGNGISNVGAFTPARPPENMLEVYNWLLSQPGNFNVYWPGANGASYPWSNKSTPSITWIDSPKPTLQASNAIPGMFPAPLQYLVASSLTGSIARYLAALNIKYLVLQPYSETGLRYSWGLSDYQRLMDTLLDSPGLSIVKSLGDITVYAVNNTWGQMYSPDLLLRYAEGDRKYAIAYNALASLESHIAISGIGSTGQNLCFDRTGCAVSMLSPSFLAQMAPGDETYVALTSPQSAAAYTLNPSDRLYLPPPDGLWTVTNWGPNEVNVTMLQTMRWIFASSSVMTLSYNGTVTNHNPGGIRVNSGNVAIVRVAFNYRTSDSSELSLRALVPLLNTTYFTTSIPQSVEFPKSGTWTRGTYNLTLPEDTAFFTTRIQASGASGWVEIKDVQLVVTMAKLDGAAPFGMALSLNGNTPLNLGNFRGFTYLQLKGEGFATRGYENFTFREPRLGWVRFASNSESPLLLSGDIGVGVLIVTQLPLSRRDPTTDNFSQDNFIRTQTNGPLIYARMFNYGYGLTSANREYSPTPTLDGLNLFSDVEPGLHTIVLRSLLGISMSYSLTLVANSLVLGLIFRQRIRTIRFRRKSN